ncbi:MAG: type II toxin-antitoxin system MqsA family antitoxin [Deltaproteobacteria bacterium]|nr:type II toxin-antitoxin system MqsA family antitoxin [Deltaproteobacteria bacterium]
MTNSKKSGVNKQSSSAVRGRGVILPIDACPSCGKALREKRSTLSFPVNGENIKVKKARHLSCPDCGEMVLLEEQARYVQREAVNTYRDKYRLLSAEEIRSVRERFGLTQAELSKILRLGPNTISRWEMGRNVQTAAMDVLLRLIRDLPESLEYLRKNVA